VALHLIALDHSGSMRGGARLAMAKAFAAGLVQEASREGAQIAVLLLGGQGAQWLQGAAPARRSAIPRLRQLGGGGGTPIAAGLRLAQAELQAFRRRYGTGMRTLWLLTDGRSLEQPEPPTAADRVVIVDFDDPLRPLGRCPVWAERWGAELRRPAQP
jgi:magnesium chelatase subunit ChlD-like protein